MAAQGDKQAWASLYSGTYSKLHRYVRSLSQKYNASQIDCDDIAAEALFRCHNKLHAFMGKSLFYTWACGFATNLFRDELKKQCRRSLVITRRYREICCVAESSYYSSDPLDLLILAERQQAVWASLKALSVIQKFLLIEHCVKKRPITVISKELDCPYEYARRQYHEACKLFSKYFHMYYHRSRL